MEKWQTEALLEVYAEIRSENPLINAGVKYVEFVSRSNGRNRKKRSKPREIRFVSLGGRTYTVGNRLTKRLEFLMQDIFPEHLSVNSTDDWLTSFVKALKEASLLAKK